MRHSARGSSDGSCADSRFFDADDDGRSYCAVDVYPRLGLIFPESANCVGFVFDVPGLDSECVVTFHGVPFQD